MSARLPVLYLAPWVGYGGSDKNTIDWFRWLDRGRFAPYLITTQPSANPLLHEIEPYAEEFWVLPEHVWGLLVGSDGKGLKSYRFEQHLFTVFGAAYEITKYQEKGTTVFKRNPNFYGSKSNADAVALTYYTNTTSMIADLQHGSIDFADQVHYNAVTPLKSSG